MSTFQVESLKQSLEEDGFKRTQHQTEMDQATAELTIMRTERKHLETENKGIMEEKNAANAAVMKLRRFGF